MVGKWVNPASPQHKKQQEITDFTEKRRNEQKTPSSYTSAANNTMKNRFAVLQNKEEDDEIFKDDEAEDAANSDDSDATWKNDNENQASTVGSESLDANSMHLDGENRINCKQGSR